jgi:tRNA pseudouridine38-40 synthase
MAIIKLILEYDGTYYHGWQKQPYLTTVQGTVEKALFRLTQNQIGIYGAGRTDAGVHALGQVAHFSPPVPFEREAWIRGLNALLPQDIVVHVAEAVSDSFHARFSAKGKTYTYFIHNAQRRSPFQRQTAWHLNYPLDLKKMRSAAKRLLGEHDFTSFCAAASEGESRRVDVREIRIEKKGEEIEVTIKAPRFLQYMVRNIVGFLVEVGKGRRLAAEVPLILKEKDRRKAGPTAPAHGLFLVNVEY